MTGPPARARSAAAFAAGVALGAAASAGTALLLYTGQGFLRAAGLLISSTFMAVAAGIWAGTPEPADTVRGFQRSRWAGYCAALIVGGILTAVWTARIGVREHAVGGALAVLLILAVPAYAAGSLLAALHAQERRRARDSAVAAGTLAGSAVGLLLATTTLIQTLSPWAIYFGGAVIVAAASLFDRRHASRHDATGENDMTGRAVIITGVGGRGQLGYAVAERFLDEGARVLITGRSAAVQELAQSLAGHGEVHAFEADLTNDDDVRALIDHARERLGRLDALINIAGGLSVVASIEETTAEQWQREIERNAGTVLRVSRAALPLLRESGGTIVNFTSPAALRAPARLAAYSAAKAAVIALTRALAVEEKETGVRVNAIAPGLMDTEQNRTAMPDTSVWVSRDDVASVVLFLAGPAAAGITGETVHVLGRTID